MIFKSIVIFFMLGIFFALARAGLSITNEKGSKVSTLTSLKWRIGLSVMVFIGLFIAFSMGYIQPHGL